MSENPLYYSGNQTSKPSNLKPALSAALASLEVQLDEELARYRRTRITRRTPTPKSLGSLIAGKPQVQNAISAANSKNQQSLTAEEAAAYIRQQQVGSSAKEIKSEIKTPPPPPVPAASPEVTFNKNNNSEIPLSETVASQEQAVPFPEATTKAQNQSIPETANQSSIVKAVTNGNIPQDNIPTPKDTTKQPDDYLESSEALLRSLQEEQQQPQTKKPKNNNDSLLSPLSIGSMALLLVSSITFGYIIFNLNNLPSLSFGGLFKRNQEVGSENTENVSDIKSDEPKLTATSRNPNLAKNELPDINNIDDIAGATPRAKPTTAAKPSTPVTSQASRVATPQATVEQMSPTVATNTPATPVTEAQPAPTPQNLDDIKPSSGGFYNVIVDNTGNNLAEAKKVIPDAYLSPEGKYVYLGAFKSKKRLKDHLELLKQKGITARVEEPDN
ncbi:hypothetical protein Riv7116_1443 [Rivularia sp. PCC 7116]|uniref:hypothetical protein n=1 Tax=Rivularia sp. PCC 7116 TaxID=373994 RepID=UPI00029F135E|nr:hypothetical protein [Rivularia sp. PCC 7116]AFY54005.1 hypothetical protein Riv7116_1443 [Rivularia sp. PCC 7116]